MDKKKVTATLDYLLWERLKIYAIRERRPISDLLGEIIEKYLDAAEKNADEPQ